MKNLILFLALMVLMPGLTACGKKDNKRTTISNRTVRNGNNANTSNNNINQVTSGELRSSNGGTSVSSSGYIYGQIYNKGGRTDAQFDQNVRGFTSATIDPWGDPSRGVGAELGTVSGQINGQTGVWIRGDARVSGGNFDPTGQNARQLDLANTNIRIIIWDSYAGQTDSEGNYIPEYGLSFTSATSQSTINYQNRTAVLVFEDAYGWVKFSGSFDQDWFHGTVQYYNFDYVSSIIAPNDGAWSGQIGEFFISTCGFFYCD